MKVLVCGGRDFNDWGLLHAELDNIRGITQIIHGGARGADKLAGDWAKSRNIPVAVFKADWRIGKAAGHIRNQRMLNEGKPDIVVAFPGGKGTADMVERAKRAEIPIIFAE